MMEKAFGTSFADVRVHVGREADRLGALAFTLGSDISFASGQYNPHTPHGRGLLGHELTHVVQQRAGRVRNPFGGGIAVVQDPGLEAEAERMRARITAASVAASVRPAQGAVQRAARPMMPTARRGVIQRQLKNKESGKICSLEITDKRISIREAETQKSYGFADYYIAQRQFYLKMIDTRAAAAPKGAGAMLVYQLAARARHLGFSRIMVTNATPEETGFYLHMGFEADPAFVRELQLAGVSGAQLEAMKHTTLSGDVNQLLDKAGASVVKNWSDPSWKSLGLSAGQHAEHGEMFHIAL
jgi:GNAT superfamily N-acetyltransferase